MNIQVPEILQKSGMKIPTYKEIRELVKKNTSQTLKFFTTEFYQTYLDAVAKCCQNTIDGVDDSYRDETIWTRHAWDKVRASDFAIATPSAYCTFLCYAPQPLEKEELMKLEGEETWMR